MYICIYIHTYINIYLYIYVYTYKYVYIYINKYIYICMYILRKYKYVLVHMDSSPIMKHASIVFDMTYSYATFFFHTRQESFI